MAIATGGTRLVIEKTLQAVGVSDLFEEVVTADDVKIGKPAPDIFLKAAQLLGVKPERCLVLEDAPEFCDQGSPWLASLYVAPEQRGRGLGARLVHAAVDAAAGQGIDQLFLFTPDHAKFYERLGWSRMLRTTLKGTPVDLMTIHPPLDKAKAVA